MIVHTDVKVELNEEEKKRWNDAYNTLCEMYEAMPKGTDAERLIESSLSYFEEFSGIYMED